MYSWLRLHLNERLYPVSTGRRIGITCGGLLDPSQRASNLRTTQKLPSYTKTCPSFIPFNRMTGKFVVFLPPQWKLLCASHSLLFMGVYN